MKTFAELLVFVLGWGGIMALIGIICWAVSRWGSKQNKDAKTENEESESLDS